MRMHPPGSDEPFDGARLKRFLNVDNQYVPKSQHKRRRNNFENRLG